MTTRYVNSYKLNKGNGQRKLLIISLCQKNTIFYQGNIMAVVRMIEAEKRTRGQEHSKTDGLVPLVLIEALIPS